MYTHATPTYAHNGSDKARKKTEGNNRRNLKMQGEWMSADPACLVFLSFLPLGSLRSSTEE